MLYVGTTLVDGSWEFPDGAVMLKASSTGTIEGNADVEYEDALIAMLFVGIQGAPRTALRLRRIELTGELFGRVWKYTMKVVTGRAGDLVMEPDTSKSSDGVILFDDRWTSGEMSEIKDGRISAAIQIKRTRS